MKALLILTLMCYNLELEKDRLGERLEAEVRVLERQVLTDT